MSILDIFKGMSATEIQGMFDQLDDAFDAYFASPGQRRRFIEACRHLSHHDLAIVHSAMTGAYNAIDPVDQAGAIENPSRVADAILMLEEDLAETKDTKFLWFLLALLQRDKVGIKLNRARELDWEYPLLENENTPPEFIQFIWDLNKKGRYKDVEWYESPRSVAKHPNCPLAALKELVQIDDAPVRKAVAKHRNIDESLTNLFLNSKRLPERQEIAKSKFVSKEALLSLMRDEHDRVSQAARKNFAKRFAGETVTDEAIDQAVKARIEKPYVESAHPKPKFSVYADSRMGVEHVLSLKPAQRAAVAKHADETVLLALADDKSTVVRRNVATRVDCPDEILVRYLTETDLALASNAFLTIARKRPEVTFESLFSEDVIDSSYNLLNTCLNQRRSLSPVLEKPDSTTEAEIERSRIVARYSDNPMIQLRIVNDLNEIPNMFTLRRSLLKALSENLHLGESATRKIVFELGFGGENVLLQCRHKALLKEYLSRDKIPPGVRGRPETHLKSLHA